MLDPRAQENEITGHAVISVGRVRRAMFGAEAGARVGEFTSAEELRQRLDGIAREQQARPVDADITLGGCIARMMDPAWWRKNLRRETLKENETIEHAAGHIRRREQCYVSDHAGHILRVRRKASRTMLEQMEVMNEEGDTFNLAEIVDKSVSNPKLRRGELMMRCRGFEEMADYQGHGAEFLTLTCPSRFHRFDGSGKLNKKWDGATPRQAQDYLCKLWGKIRAAWKRKGFAPYGFRVAEPHHDGCPHWHILLFMPKEHAGWFMPGRFIAGEKEYGAGVLGIAGRYALKDSPTERGAAAHRFTVKHIDPDEGSATGYIAKYICKNIDGAKEDGEQMGLDFASGTNAAESSKRVRDWASAWHIRQFQQIGGPSVTVWRELRRVGQDIEVPLQPSLFDMAQSAADRSLWSLFWMLQGGPDVARKSLAIKTLYEAGEVGRYGDNTAKIWGVSCREDGQDTEHQTRLHTWTIQRAGLADTNAADADFKEYRAGQKRNAEFIRLFQGFEVERIGAAERTWTGVNNCTGKPVFDFSNFEKEPEFMPDTWAGHVEWRGIDAGNPEIMQEDIEYAWKQYDKINSRMGWQGIRQ